VNRILHALRARDDERGVALVAVVGVGMVVMMLVATLVAVSSSGARLTTNDRDWARAAAAAYAGIADYQARLNADNSYGTHGQEEAPFSKDSGSKFSDGPGGNPAFGYRPEDRWVDVPGRDGTPSGGSYRYAVDNSKLTSQGAIRVQSTGRAGSTTRTFIANVRPDGFSNYLYFTNYESQDPSVSNETVNSTCGGQQCKVPCTSEYRPFAVGTTCQYIQFAARDLLEGPVRSNDQFRICGATFQGTVQSVYGWTKAGCTGTTPTFASNPTTSSTLTPPATIADLRDYTREDLRSTTDTPEGPGCLFTGPTKITFLGGGKVNIVSPMTVKTWVKGAAEQAGGFLTGGTQPARCGDVEQLHSPTGATIDIPKNNLIYVQNEPAVRSSGGQDPNLWSSSEYKRESTACDVTTRASTATTLPSNGVGFPEVGSTNEADPTAGLGNTVTDPYGCDNGDVFVKGTVDKAVTVAAENYVYVTGDITYPATRSASTVLGLIGQRAVWVWNPINQARQPYKPANRRIDAAILANDGTFAVQNYTLGSSRGTLTVNGSIAQNFRGAVGTGSGASGYYKDYAYDPSLATYTPPKFPQPTITTYRVATQLESRTAYAASGAAVP
jgi:hypothetical protein